MEFRFPKYVANGSLLKLLAEKKKTKNPSVSNICIGNGLRISNKTMWQSMILTFWKIYISIRCEVY